MSKELYLVTFNGYVDAYGEEIYLGGIFNSRDKADNYINKQKHLSKESFKISLIPLNREFNIEKQHNWSYISGVYLGGYVE